MLKKLIQKWLGIPGLVSRIAQAESGVRDLRKELHDQIKMVGVDVHMRNRRGGGPQTEIIFISHLGPEGTGSIHIVDAEFRDYSELMNYVKYMSETLKHRPVIDGPMGMGREFKRFLDL